MTSADIDDGNAYANMNAYNNNNNNNTGTGSNLNESTERTLRLKCTSEQGRFLAYLTVKHMVRTQGPHFQKGVSLGLNTWMAITRELNALGIEKTPEQWRKCYSAAKYFAHMRFMRMMREKQAATGNPNVRPDWNEIEIRDLLYLQDWRCKGFPDMPEAATLINAFENKQMYLHEYHPPKQNFVYQRDQFYDNNSFPGNPNTFNDFSQYPVTQQQHHQHDEVQIKCELDGSIDVDASEEFTQQLQQMVDEQSRSVDYGVTSRPNSTQSTNSPVTKMAMPKPMPMPMPMPLPLPTTTAHAENETYTNTSTAMTIMRNSSSRASSNCRVESLDCEQSQPHHPVSSDVISPELSYHFEQRFLEISEKLLKEKIKQNRILRKKHKILKQTRREQKKQTETLNKLLEQLVRRS